jgi:hypothetical protein
MFIGRDPAVISRRLTLLTGMLLATLSLAAAPAGRQARMAPPDPDAEAAAVTQMVTAAEVATWARANGDVQALLVAARMLDEVRTRPQSGDEPFLTPGALLEEAERMAGDDPAVQAQVLRMRTLEKGVRASAFGAGPIVMVRRVRARETFGFEVDARPNEVLRVAAIGDGDTNIDLVLREREGAVLCSDSSLDHYPVCTLVRPRGGPVRIEVVNRGSVWSRVQVLTN